MSPTFSAPGVQLYHADCRDVLESLPAVAELLGNMPISTLEKNKEIPVVRIGASVYYDTADLWRWVESKKSLASAS